MVDKRRKRKDLISLNISVTDQFEKELKILSSMYNENASATLTNILEEIFHDEEKYYRIRKYIRELYGEIGRKEVTKTCVIKIYNIPDYINKRLKSEIKERIIENKSKFISAAVSYYYNFRFMNKKDKAADIIEKMKKIGIEVNEEMTFYTEKGFYIFIKDEE